MGALDSKGLQCSVLECGCQSLVPAWLIGDRKCIGIGVTCGLEDLSKDEEL